MKICVAGLRGLPGVMGGIETHCEQLYPRLKALRPQYDIEVLSRAPYTGAEPYRHDGVRVTPLPSPSGRSSETIVHTIRAVLHARFRSRADVMHIHAVGPALTAPLARLLGLRTVVTHHGRDYDRAKWGVVAKFMLRLGEIVGCLAADHVLVVSESVTVALKRRFAFKADRIVHVPNGVTDLRRATGARGGELLSELGVANTPYVLAVARLVPEKGLHDLVEAFERANRPGVKLVVAGGADHADDYSRSLQGRASERVVFAGFRNHDALAVLYGNASLFVLPSYHEGLPIVGLEAAAFGLPMLLSDIPANRELALPDANYFPAGDVAALAAKLERPFEEHRAATRDLLHRFDWNAIAAETASVLDRLGRRTAGARTEGAKRAAARP